MSFYIKSTVSFFLLFSISACGVNHLVCNKERFNPEEKEVVFSYVTKQNVPLHFIVIHFELSASLLFGSPSISRLRSSPLAPN